MQKNKGIMIDGVLFKDINGVLFRDIDTELEKLIEDIFKLEKTYPFPIIRLKKMNYLNVSTEFDFEDYIKTQSSVLIFKKIFNILLSFLKKHPNRRVNMVDIQMFTYCQIDKYGDMEFFNYPIKKEKIIYLDEENGIGSEKIGHKGNLISLSKLVSMEIKILI